MQSRISVNPYGVEVSEDRRRRGSFEIHWLTDGLIAIYYNLFTFKFSLVSQSHLIQAFDRRTGPFDFTWLIHSPVRLDMVCSHMQDGAAHVDRHRSMNIDLLWIVTCFGLLLFLRCEVEIRRSLSIQSCLHCSFMPWAQISSLCHRSSLTLTGASLPIASNWDSLISFACHMHDSYWFMLYRPEAWQRARKNADFFKVLLQLQVLPGA
jgi:hypothetical protein